jgi:hypothetical protein
VSSNGWIPFATVKENDSISHKTSNIEFFFERNAYYSRQSLHYIVEGENPLNFRPSYGAAVLFSTKEIARMSNTEKSETLSKALVAALLRLGVATAVFEPSELALPEPYSLRCRHQADGSVAVILEAQTR